MLIHRRKKFAFLSNPKTASTTIEMWLGRKPGISSFQGDPKFKHTNYRTFAKVMRAYAEPVDDYEVMCIARHPLDKARSWFKYRSRSELSNNPERYLGDQTFTSYIEDALARHAAGERSFEFLNLRFVWDEQSSVGVSKVFPYERINEAMDYLRRRLDLSAPLPAQARNVSPPVDTSLSDALTQAFAEAFADELYWYQSLV